MQTEGKSSERRIIGRCRFFQRVTHSSLTQTPHLSKQIMKTQTISVRKIEVGVNS